MAGDAESASGRRRRLIIDAALTILAEEGGSALTFARVVEVAELSSSRLITYHFTDRDGLLRAMTERVLDDFGRAVAADLASGGTVPTQLRRLFAAQARFMRDHRGHIVALATLVLPGSGGAGSAARVAGASSAATGEALAGMIRDGQASGDIRAHADPDAAAFLIQRALEGLAMAVAADSGLDPVPAAEGMAEIVVAGLSTRAPTLESIAVEPASVEPGDQGDVAPM